MTQFYRLAMPILALALAPSCDSTRAHASKAAPQTIDRDRELAAAPFEDRKQIRLLGVHAERAMLGSQPLMIATFAARLPLTHAARASVDDKLAAFTQRLVEADTAIRDLEAATAQRWVTLDRATAAAMRQLEDARDDAWATLEGADRSDRSS